MAPLLPVCGLRLICILCIPCCFFGNGFRNLCLTGILVVVWFSILHNTRNLFCTHVHVSLAQIRVGLSLTLFGKLSQFVAVGIWFEFRRNSFKLVCNWFVIRTVITVGTPVLIFMQVGSFLLPCHISINLFHLFCNHNLQQSGLVWHDLSSVFWCESCSGLCSLLGFVQNVF